MPFESSIIGPSTQRASLASGVYIDSYTIGGNDVDIIAVELVAGRHYGFTAQTFQGDAFLRIFDALGNEVEALGESSSAGLSVLDAHFIATHTGTFYVAVSRAYLQDYDPFTTAGRTAPQNSGPPSTGNLTMLDYGNQGPLQYDSIAETPATAGGGLILADDDDRARSEFTTTEGVDSGDVDMTRIELEAGDLVVVDINGTVNAGNTLDSVLRVFNDSGVEIAYDEASGLGVDSEAVFTVNADGNYYIAVSGEGNRHYNALDGSGTTASDSGDFSMVVHLNPTMVGSSAADALAAGFGDAYIVGLNGNDTLDGNDGRDTISGGDGADRIDGGRQQDQLFGDMGNDVIDGGAGGDLLVGGWGDDELAGGTGTAADVLDGGGGSDTLDGGAGNDSLDGGAGADSLRGGGGADSVVGGDGDDTLFGDAGEDYVAGGDGRDTVQGGDSADTLLGGDGADTINGNGGADVVLGGEGDDSLLGTAGDDVLLGGGDADVLRGGADRDRLEGGSGVDTLTGGTEADVFVFDAVDGSADTITDLVLGEDLIELAGLFGAGTVDASNLSQYVRVVNLGVSGDCVLQVDADGGAGGFNFVDIALVQGVTAGQLFDAGNFIL